MKKHLWKGNPRTECGRLTLTMDPKYLEEKRGRVTCEHCLRLSGAKVGIYKTPRPKKEQPLEVFAARMFRPSRTKGLDYSPPAGWMRIFKEWSDAEKYVLKACRAIVGRNEDFGKKWVHRKRSHILDIGEARFDITQHRVI